MSARQRNSPSPQQQPSMLIPTAMGISKRRARVVGTEWNYQQQDETLSTTTATAFLKTTTSTIIELPPPHWKVHRVANHMSDAQYARSSYHHASVYDDDSMPVRHKPPPPPLFTKRGCVSTCASFSLIAILMLIFLGVLLDTQPFYVHGALVVQQTYVTNTHNRVRTRPVHMLPLERLPAAATAYKTAVAYFFTYLACQWYLRGECGTRRFKQRQYQNIPELPHHQHNNNTNATQAMYEQYETAPRRYMSSMVQRWRVEWNQYMNHWGFDTTNGHRNNKRGKHTPKTI